MEYLKSTDAKASKRHMEFSAEISIFIRFLLYVQLFHFNCIEKQLYIAIRVKLLTQEPTNNLHRSLIKILILDGT